MYIKIIGTIILLILALISTTSSGFDERSGYDWFGLIFVIVSLIGFIWNG